jgi:plastocyanin
MRTESTASVACSLYSCKSGASEFTKTSLPVDSAATWSPASNYLTVGTSLFGVGYSSDNETSPTFDTILTGLDPSSGKLSSIGSLGYGKADGIAGTASILAKPEASVGNGLVIAGQTLAGSGDLQLIGTDASMTKLGSFGLSSADGLAVGSMAMLGGRLYLNCASRATEDGLSTGLYSLPAAAAAKLATTDVAETASVSADGGGTAAVSDWRGGTASELSVRSGDTVTWTATADAGHTFVGWYDAAGNEVSSDAVYSATAGTGDRLDGAVLRERHLARDACVGRGAYVLDDALDVRRLACRGRLRARARRVRAGARRPEGPGGVGSRREAVWLSRAKTSFTE